ncbi:hypothetical protein HW130_15660 [Streptomyces sp. PKU-EA00015]|uniref:hypothetical protein n=1 Tax=Streptomyces sp. PKU-EA00015 TaxID=2748326 RepID=UPI0015A1A39D|nr:hypothetical protein [Streptomyces sp. PKU-EA00015]NWF27683.1 hypothetical protein [Streptomyces sp. PKU-EA00015]
MSLGDEHDSRTNEGFGGSGQTRTRLPGTSEDIYGGARRPVRTSRSLIGVVGVVVLLIAAIAFANKGGGAEDTSGDTGKSPDSRPTAATGVRPVKGNEGGIPTGYARDEQGAQSAAANYAVALGSAEMFDKAKRDGILDVVITPTAVNTFRTTLDKAYSPSFFKNVGLNEDGSTPNGFTFISRTSPIGTKITNFAGTRATVEVWCTGLIGLAGEGSTNPVTDGWFTITMELEWVNGDWKAVTHSQKDGPAPVGGDTRASSAEEIAGAVNGYGGFTYAR